MEKRALLAVLLSLLVIIIYQYFFMPEMPIKQPVQKDIHSTWQPVYIGYKLGFFSYDNPNFEMILHAENDHGQDNCRNIGCSSIIFRWGHGDNYFPGKDG